MEDETLDFNDLELQEEASIVKLGWNDVSLLEPFFSLGATDSATTATTATATPLDMIRVSIPNITHVVLEVLVVTTAASSSSSAEDEPATTRNKQCMTLLELEGLEHAGFQGILSDFLDIHLKSSSHWATSLSHLLSCQSNKRDNHCEIQLTIRDPSGNAFCSMYDESAAISLMEDTASRTIAEEKVIKKNINTAVDVSAFVKKEEEGNVEKIATEATKESGEYTTNEEADNTQNVGEIGCGVGRFELQEEDWKEPAIKCNACERVIRPRELRLRCMECPDVFLCSTCRKTLHDTCPADAKSRYVHKMIEESDAQVAMKKTLRDLRGGVGVQMAAACAMFAHRECLGSQYDVQGQDASAMNRETSFMIPQQLRDALREDKKKEDIEDENKSNTLSMTPRSFYYFTYKEVHHYASRIATCLNTLLCSAGPPVTTTIPKVALLMKNCCEWAILDVALSMMGVVIVPIDPGVNKANLRHILATTEASMILVEDRLLRGVDGDNKPTPLWELALSSEQDGKTTSTPHLKHLVELDFHSIFLEESPNSTHVDPHSGNLQVHNLHQLFASVDATALMKPVPRKKTDIFTLIFTSGSTGNPKGAIQTHEIWAESSFDKLLPSHPVAEVLYRPLSYATDREALWLGLGNGGRMSIHTDAISELFESLAEIAPTTFSAPPRIWNSLYDRFVAEVNQLRADREDLDADVTERKILRKFSKKMGHRVRMIGTGSAPIRPEVYEFLEECFMRVGGVPVYESYGTTEAGGITLNGYLYSGVQLMLLNVPSMGFMTTNTPYKQGEICVISGVAMPGYWKNATASTALYFVDTEGNRWCRTGDIGEVRDGKLHVIDRIANLVKLANGVFYSPEHLEGAFQLCESVKDVFVYGHSSWDFPLVAVYPNKSGDGDDEVTTTTERRILAEMRRIAESRDDIPKEVVPRGVFLSDVPFTVDNKLLTISMKPSRPNLRIKFCDDLKKMYKEMTGQDPTPVADSSPCPAGAKSPSSKTSASSSQALLHQVTAVFKATLRQPHIDPAHDTAKSLGADSISIALLKEKLKALCGLNMTIQELWVSTISRVAKKVAATLSGQAEGDPQEDSANVLRMLENDIMWQNVESEGKRNDEQNENANSIVLTGATGFIGRHILASLLSSQSQSRTIYCLVRGATADACKNKLLNAFIELPPAQQDALRASLENDQVKVVQGDLGIAGTLGIDDTMKMELQSQVRTVVHAGAHVNHTMPYSELRVANVESTRTLLRLFCESRGTKTLRFVFLSSGSVGTHDEPCSATEETPPCVVPEQLEDECGYIASKWASEQLLFNFQRHAPPPMTSSCHIQIARVGMTSWCSETGAGNPSDWLCQLAVVIKAIGGYPSGLPSYSLVIAPVDWVADCVISMFNNTPQEEQIEPHLTTAAAPTLHNLSSPRQFDAVSLYRALGCDAMDRNQWKESLRTLAENEEKEGQAASRAARAILALFGGSVPAGEKPDIFGEESKIRSPSLSRLNSRLLQCEEHVTKFAKWIGTL